MRTNEKATITVSRISFYTVGVRLWFVVASKDNKTRYQRWSLGMDASDECLMIAQPGDVLNLEYTETVVDGKVTKNTIASAEFK
jgi:hypothetical protein